MGQLASQELVNHILSHHGVKGMKWGVQKGRSSGPSAVTVKTGSSSSGKATIKTGGGSGHAPHHDAVAAKIVQQKLSKSGTHALSNKEIQTLVNRHNLETQAKRLQPKSGYKQAVQHVSNFLSSPQGKASVELAKSSATSDRAKKFVKTAVTAAKVAAVVA